MHMCMYICMYMYTCACIYTYVDNKERSIFKGKQRSGRGAAIEKHALYPSHSTYPPQKKIVKMLIVYIYIYTYTYIYIYMYIYIYTYTYPRQKK